MGFVVNLLIRILLLYFLFEVILFPNDPRFAGKAIPIRNFIIVLSLSFFIPVINRLQKKFSNIIKQQKRYPFFIDSLYLSIFLFDMIGNSYNLYDTYAYFDLLAHFHGAGAFAATSYGILNISSLTAIGLANVIHILLEAQEFYTDVFFNTHNVRGTFDVINDLLVGVLGTFCYILLFLCIKKIRNTQQPIL